MIVDFCAYLGEWPTYEFRHRNAQGLLQLMDRCGIAAACVSLAGGMLRYDAHEANERLLAESLPSRLAVARRHARPDHAQLALGPGGRPAAPRDGRLAHPAHLPRLRARPPGRLGTRGASGCSGRPLFLTLYVEEERSQHPAIRVPEVPIAGIVSLVERVPETTIVLNGLKTGHAARLFEAPVALDHVHLDVHAMDQPFAGLQALVARHGAQGLLFGSQIPFLYPEAALMLVCYALWRTRMSRRSWRATGGRVRCLRGSRTA